MTVGIQREGAHRTHLVAEQPYVDQTDRKGRVVGPPIPAPARSLCGVRIAWFILSGSDDCQVTCERCYDAAWAAIPSPTGGGSAPG